MQAIQCYHYYKKTFFSLCRVSETHAVEQCIATTETRNSPGSIGKQHRRRRLLLHHDLVSITGLKMLQGKCKARYFLITLSEVKFHGSCCYCLYETSVIERVRNLIPDFSINTFKKTEIPLNH